MFGFLGHGQAEQIVEAAGENTGTRREFNMKNYALRNDFRKIARAFFDIDNVNVTKADRQTLLVNTPEVNYDTTIPDVTLIFGHVYTPIVQGGYTFIILFPPNDNSAKRGFQYLSTAALSPVTRKCKHIFYRPELVEMIALVPLQNNSAQSAASNMATSVLTIDLSQFPNCKSLYLNEGFVSTLNLKFNKNLKSFHLSEYASSLTLNGQLPSSCHSALIGNVAGLTSINSFLSQATGLESLLLGAWSPFPSLLANALTTLTGTLDLTNQPLLKEFTIANNSGLTTLSLPTGKSDWRFFYATILGSAGTSLPDARLNEIITSSTLQVFCFINIAKSYARNFVDADFTANLKYFWIYQTSFNGNITLTTARAGIIQFRTGLQNNRTGIQQNSHPTVNVTGLTNATIIDFSGSNVDNLELPVNTVCTSLLLQDNKLDNLTNTNLKAQIAAMTALVTLALGNASNTVAGAVGQNSTNGLGVFNISTLINVVSLFLDKCKITGALTLANVNKITSMSITDNPGITSIPNLAAHIGMQAFRAAGAGTFAIPSAWTSLFFLRLDGSGVTDINLSGITNTGNKDYNGPNCLALTAITFPTTTARMVMAAGFDLNFSGCTSLAALTNMSNINWNATGTNANSFSFQGCALNIPFTFGANSFIPRIITIQNNGMSSANVDATINNLYTDRTKWNVYSAAKSMNIAGTNGAAGGTYQAPAGFVLGVSDGTPASAKEQLYVLVNNYSWTMTFN